MFHVCQVLQVHRCVSIVLMKLLICLSVCELPLKPGFCLIRWLLAETVLLLPYHHKLSISSAQACVL